MQSLVEWGISKGLREFDLTIGDESFKREWADHSLPLHDCVRALTGRAKIYLGCVRARNRLAEWAKQSERFRALVRRLRSRYRIRL
jgi:CelD/BcsL family acetyltransferase involved in cellulose biosynthesis